MPLATLAAAAWRGDNASEIVLARLEKVHALLAEVETVPQAKEAIAAAKAVEIYARETKASEAILRLAFHFKSLAKYRLGEMVVKEKAAGRLREGRPGKTVDGDDRFSLADLGISKDESSQAQEFASVSEEAFKELLLGGAGSGELSDAALLRRIRAAKAGTTTPAKAKRQPNTKATTTADANNPNDNNPNDNKSSGESATVPGRSAGHVSLPIQVEGVEKEFASWRRGWLEPLRKRIVEELRWEAGRRKLELVARHLTNAEAALGELAEEARKAIQ
jgi:hypothetical protein